MSCDPAPYGYRFPGDGEPDHSSRKVEPVIITAIESAESLFGIKILPQLEEGSGGAAGIGWINLGFVLQEQCLPKNSNQTGVAWFS